MRRWLSILLVLFFGLWPLAGALEDSGDARLPACCRRHGAHHCAMAMQMAAMWAQSSTPSFSAPPTCPLFPEFKAGPSTPADALAASAAQARVLLLQGRALLAGGVDWRLAPLLTRAGRGPPASSLS